MMRRLLGPALAGALVVGVSACDTGDRSGTTVASRPAADAAPAALADIGGPLFPPKEVPALPPAAPPAEAPIVVRQCQVTLSETQNVPSKNSGRLLYYCTDPRPGEVVPKDQIIVHPRTKKEYRKLKEGDVVRADDLIGFLDDKLAYATFATEQAAVEAGKAKLEAAIQLKKTFEEEYRMYYRLWETKAGSESDMRRSRAQYDKSVADVEDARGTLLKSEQDRNKAQVILDEHEVRTTIPGTVKRLYRRPGESIKELDPVAEIQNVGKLRVEGLLEIQYLPQLARAKATGKPVKVAIDVARQTGPTQQFDGHFQPVRGVAVSKDPKRPLIVSASEDRTAQVWDRLAGNKAVLPHPAAVRAVACTPPGSDANLALTGADDGVARLWDLDSPEPAKAVRELKGRHQGRIVSAAFAPDGKTCVTADERDIYLWDVASGDLKYRFPGQHRGQITYVQYTPQAKLLSVARDHSLCLWKLGEKGAAPDKVIDYRSGDVPVLGVSPDGQRALFDQERALHVLSLADATFQRTEGVLPAPSEASQFASFALFSPDGKMVLAAGTADSPLQLWTAPAPGVRPHLIRRGALAPASAPTCAAFAPDGSFVVTGTQDNKVVVWGLPNDAEARRELGGELTFTDISIDPAERKARVWADLANPGDVNLLPGETATLVILLPPDVR